MGLENQIDKLKEEIYNLKVELEEFKKEYKTHRHSIFTKNREADDGYTSTPNDN